MWFNYPETFHEDDWEFMVCRRGFNIQEQHSLISALHKHGFDITNIHLIDVPRFIEVKKVLEDIDKAKALSRKVNKLLCHL
jgi:hypothetical protein